MDDQSWRFAYDPPTILSGRDAVTLLGTELAELGCDRALVICGKHVGANERLMQPIEAALAHQQVGTFAQTTPAKQLATALAAREQVRETEADVVIGVGGGSSLDVTKQVALLTGMTESAPDLAAFFAEHRTLPEPTQDPLPIITIPTTLAGAELSTGAGMSANPSTGLVEQAVSGGISDPRLQPVAVVSDPGLVGTTPRRVLAGSAMNGFDKGLEALYSPAATPITDATAVAGLQRLALNLPALSTDRLPDDALDAIVAGNLLVQYGVSRPGATLLSLIHAIGHVLRDAWNLQQGVAHAIVAPHALSYLFDKVDGRRELIARALGCEAADDQAVAIVDRVTEIRDQLGVPTRLRDVSAHGSAALSGLAADVLEDSLMEHLPAGLEPSRSEIAGILRAAH